jgi:hypothetical protein
MFSRRSSLNKKWLHHKPTPAQARRDARREASASPSPVTMQGEGTYGCVVKPTLPCGSEQFDPATTVSKLFVQAREADTELHEAEKLKTIDPLQEFTVQPLAMCEIPTPSDAGTACIKLGARLAAQDTITQIVYPYAGVPVRAFTARLRGLMSALLRLAEGRLAHRDLHAGNILDDGARTRVIDFGLMEAMDGIYVWPTGFRSTYRIWPPEFNKFIAAPVTGDRVLDLKAHAAHKFDTFSVGKLASMLAPPVGADDALLRKLRVFIAATTHEDYHDRATPEAAAVLFDALFKSAVTPEVFQELAEDLRERSAGLTAKDVLARKKVADAARASLAIRLVRTGL